MNDDHDPVNATPDPLNDALRRALSKPVETVPGMTRRPYRRGDIDRAVARRRRKYGR